MADIGDLLDGEILRGAPTLDTSIFRGTLSPGELFDAMPGASWAAKVREWAELEAGPDRGRKAYKNSYARIRRQHPSPARRAKGAKALRPSKKSQQRNTQTQRKLRARRLEADGYLAALRLHGGELGLLVRISADEFWAPRGGGSIHIRQRAMRTVLRTWADGEQELAAEELLYEFERAYPLPSPEVLDMRLEPSQGRGEDERYTGPSSPFAREQ
jgi:hypothetical protein